MEENTLVITGLHTQFHTSGGRLPAVDGIQLTIPKGKIVGLVGESGCGKSVTALSILGLVRPPGHIAAGEILFEGQNLRTLSPRAMQRLRGDRIAMIFQDPMTSLNPVYTVGRQVAEALRLHRGLSRAQAHDKTLELFRSVGIPDAAERFHCYPSQLSGGLRQRVMIAMAMACSPSLLIADEPTTALDVTIQAQILSLMRDLSQREGTAILLITHNMGVVAQLCDYVYVMYAGQIVEQAETFSLFQNPRHPYTLGLLGAMPSLDEDSHRLHTIPGSVPDLRTLPPGCRFCQRCDRAQPLCETTPPPLAEWDEDRGHRVRCLV